VLGRGGQVRCATREGSWGDVPLPDVATAIAAGTGGTCALLRDGRVQCWGCDRPNEIGSESATFDFRRLDPPAGRVRGVSVGASQACATTTDGEILCWGHWFNRYAETSNMCDPQWLVLSRGQRSNAAYRVIAPPAAPDGLLIWLGRDGRVHPRAAEPPDPIGPILDLGGAGALAPTMGSLDIRPSEELGAKLGAGHLCAALEKGELACWGADLFGADAYSVAFPMAAVQVAVGNRHVCARLRDGTVRCWGQPWATPAAPIADGDGRTESEPYEIPILRGVAVVRIAPGNRDTACAVAEGAVTCWGDPLD